MLFVVGIAFSVNFSLTCCEGELTIFNMGKSRLAQMESSWVSTDFVPFSN